MNATPYKIAQRVNLDGVIRQRPGLDENGREIADPTPVAPPLGFVKQPSMMENMRNMVRSELLRREVAAAGFETFEEASDFEVGDDFDPSSPFEEQFDPETGASSFDPPPPEAPLAPQAATPVPPSDGPGTPPAGTAAAAPPAPPPVKA